MKKSITTLLFALSLSGLAQAELLTKESAHGVQETMDKFASIVTEKGMTVFARIDHAKNAESVGMQMPDSQLLIFGNPKGGTPFMLCAQTVRIDLPLKVLVWTDADGKVWLGYNDPADLARRHGAPDCPVVAPMTQALSGLAKAAVARVRNEAEPRAPNTVADAPLPKAAPMSAPLPVCSSTIIINAIQTMT